MTSTSIALRGVTLSCRQRGQGEPLVLVHGNLSDKRSWDALEPLLAPHFCVVTYSRRFAHPNVPIAAGAHDPLERHADDLAALVEQLGLGPVHLVGNSSGAYICLLLARQRPGLVRTLTLEEPPVIPLFLPTVPPRPADLLRLLVAAPGLLLPLLRFGATTVAPATRAFRRGDLQAGVDIFGRGVLGAAAYQRLGPARRQQMLDNAAPHAAALLGARLPAFSASDAAAIAVPTQLLHGVDTPAFQRGINQRLAALVPAAVSIGIPGASHLVHEDNPQAVAAAVLALCRRAAGRPAPP